MPSVEPRLILGRTNWRDLRKLIGIRQAARKYHVGLVLAHQELRQLRDRELESAVLTNPATRVCFRLGDEDARKLAEGFASFDAQDLQSLGVGEAICRIERADQDFNLRVAPPQQVTEATAKERREAIRSVSRTRCGTPKEEVEAVLAEARKESVLEAPLRGRRSEAVETPRELTSIPAEEASAPDASPNLPVADRPVRRVSSSPSRAAPRVPEIESTPGRGGAQHKYLQSLIKHFAEEKEFRATIEAPVPGGGRVDVLLERGAQSIACEISVGSSPAQEVGNLEKCVRGGFGRVVVVSPERKTLKRIAALAEKTLPEADRSCVSFVTPEELLGLLDDLKLPTENREATVLGYRVKTSVKTLGAADLESRKETVIQTVLRSLKRLKE